MPTEMTGEIRSSGGLGLPRVRVGLSVLRGQCVLRGVPFSWPVISGGRPQGVSVGYFIRDGRHSIPYEVQVGERGRVVPCDPCGFGLGSDPFIAPRGNPSRDEGAVWAATAISRLSWPGAILETSSAGDAFSRNLHR